MKPPPIPSKTLFTLMVQPWIPSPSGPHSLKLQTNCLPQSDGQGGYCFVISQKVNTQEDSLLLQDTITSTLWLNVVPGVAACPWSCRRYHK